MDSLQLKLPLGNSVRMHKRDDIGVDLEAARTLLGPFWSVTFTVIRTSFHTVEIRVQREIDSDVYETDTVGGMELDDMRLNGRLMLTILKIDSDVTVEIRHQPAPHIDE